MTKELPSPEDVKAMLEKGWLVWDAELGEGIDMLYGIIMAEICWAYVNGDLTSTPTP